MKQLCRDIAEYRGEIVRFRGRGLTTMSAVLYYQVNGEYVDEWPNYVQNGSACFDLCEELWRHGYSIWSGTVEGVMVAETTREAVVRAYHSVFVGSEGS